VVGHKAEERSGNQAVGHRQVLAVGAWLHLAEVVRVAAVEVVEDLRALLS